RRRRQRAAAAHGRSARACLCRLGFARARGGGKAVMIRALRGERYLPAGEAWLRRALIEQLPSLDLAATRAWYTAHAALLSDPARAFLCCNDRYFLLTGPLARRDMDN